ncbi:MAG: hypothetical protein FWC57_02585 [Endomicrobia bacterium]|nr:hypothetical protein [Endomicrobiia bacterium]
MRKILIAVSVFVIIIISVVELSHIFAKTPGINELAKQGYAYAQYGIGKMYFEKQNYAEAKYRFEKAAELGNIEAQTFLNDTYNHDADNGIFGVKVMSAEKQDIGNNKQAVVVPEDSLINLDNKDFLIPIAVVDAASGDIGKVKMAPVVIGDKIEGGVAVLEGINEGDLVITATQGRLSDELRVKIVREE